MGPEEAGESEDIRKNDQAGEEIGGGKLSQERPASAQKLSKEEVSGNQIGERSKGRG